MILDGLEPRSVFRFFEAISAIPRGSGNTKAVSDFCLRFARERGLEARQDDLGSVVIHAPAAPGYESAPPVILQGHLDMVCAKAPGCDKNMETEGLELFTEGDWIGARGTSLGGDDGAAVAMILALLDDPSIPRPAVEAVLTVDEETGMFGAQGLDCADLRGRTMLNLDSEAEGVFTVACAGGARVRLRWTPARETAAAQPLKLTVSGLLGGHSGVEIDKGRGNASVLLGRLLRAAEAAAPLRLVSLSGGTADNAIPHACEGVIAVDPANTEAVCAAVDALTADLRGELAQTDPGLRVGLQPFEPCELSVCAAEDTRRLLDALALVPNGIQTMSFALPGLPESSLNLGMLSLEEAGACMTFSVRASVASRKRAIIDVLLRVAAVTGAQTEVAGDYPAWEYRADSPLRERMVRIYREKFGAEPKVLAIHAGLECGLLAEKLPGLDCVSIGPDMRNIHTAGERLSVSSMARTWDFVLAVLRDMR